MSKNNQIWSFVSIGTNFQCSVWLSTYINQCPIMHFFCSGLSLWHSWIKCRITKMIYWFLRCFRMPSVELYMECDLQRSNKAFKRMLDFSVILSPTNWHLSDIAEGTWVISRDACQVHRVRRQKQSIVMYNHLKWPGATHARSVTDRRLGTINRNVECILIHSRSEDTIESALTCFLTSFWW